MEYVWGFIILVIFGVFFERKKGINKKKKRERMLEEIKKIDDFDITHDYIEGDAKNGIALDNLKHKFCVITNKDNKYNISLYNYKDLLEVEILEDGGSVTKAARGSQIGSMLIGGLALGAVGAVGAVVGGLSSKKNNIEKVKKIDLKLIVNNIDNPLFVINFFKTNDNKGYSKDSFIYEAYRKKADEWYSRLSVLIKKADEEDRVSKNTKID